jgi:hypothetical protein
MPWRNLSILPLRMFSIAAAGLPLRASDWAAISRSFSISSAGTCSRLTAVGMGGGDLEGDVADELLELLGVRRWLPCRRRLRRARRPCAPVWM